ncbi:MAG: metallophosphoesterase family protein [Isosphaeraceae bacterium]
MRIGILSDTHDHLNRTARAVALLKSEGAEALIHCGDLTTPEIVHQCAELPSSFVLGNNDFDEVGLRAAVELIGGVFLGWGGEVILGDRRIAVTHGDSTKEMRRLAAEGPDYLLFGHTHQPSDRRDGPTRLINPGALHRARTWTVAVLDLATDDLHLLTVS